MSGVSTILYLSSNSVGIGKMIVFTILVAVVGASLVFGVMDNVRNTDGTVAIKILYLK